MSTTKEITLTGIIRAVLEDAELLTPDEVADEVVKRTPAAMVRKFYRQAVREKARVIMQLAFPDALPSRTEPPLMHEGTAAGAKKTRPVSWRVNAIAEAHQARLNSRHYVDGGWKFFGDCTVRDLGVLADAREAKAASLHSMASKFRHVAKEMENLGVVTVADLPAEVLEDALR